MLLVVSMARALVVINLKAFHRDWLGKSLAAAPLNFIDVMMPCAFLAMFVVNVTRPKEILGYAYLLTVIIATGSNLVESYDNGLNILTVVALMIPIAAASSITKPAMSIVFSIAGSIELVLVSATHASFPEVSLLLSVVFIGVLGWYVMITMEKTLDASQQSESKFRALASELELRIQEKIKELEATRKDLDQQEKLAMLGKFASTISHDLRTPLGVISNAVYILERDPTIAGEKPRKYLALINDSVNRSTDYLGELMDFIRVGEPRLVTAKMNEIIEDTIKHVIIPRNVSVVSQFHPDLPLVKVDPRQMQRAVQNIIVNALQAMKDTGGKLTISTSIKDDTISIDIADTGPGIPADVLSHLFEPFFTTKPNGIGLGLPTVKDIISKHHGSVLVDSTPGKGTKFMIQLKLFDPDTPQNIIK